MVWTNKLTVSQHLNTSCQLPFLLPSLLSSPLCLGQFLLLLSTWHERFFFLISLFFFPSTAFFCVLLSFPLLSQVFRHRIRAKICIGFRACWDSSSPSPAWLLSFTPLLLFWYYGTEKLTIFQTAVLCCNCFWSTCSSVLRRTLQQQQQLIVDTKRAWKQKWTHGGTRETDLDGCAQRQDSLCPCNRQGQHS